MSHGQLKQRAARASSKMRRDGLDPSEITKPLASDIGSGDLADPISQLHLGGPAVTPPVCLDVSTQSSVPVTIACFARKPSCMV